MGALFGIAHCFRHIKEFDWYKGSKKLRILRIIVANCLMIPSWILVIFQEDLLETDFIRLSGLNDYFLNIIHFFILYLWIFGFVPLIVFDKLKINFYTKKQKVNT